VDTKLLAAVKVGCKQTEIREFPMAEPFIMGHENVGTIAQIGRLAAQGWGLKEGDRVEEALASTSIFIQERGYIKSRKVFPLNRQPLGSPLATVGNGPISMAGSAQVKASWFRVLDNKG